MDTLTWENRASMTSQCVRVFKHRAGILRGAGRGRNDQDDMPYATFYRHVVKSCDAARSVTKDTAPLGVCKPRCPPLHLRQLKQRQWSQHNRREIIQQENKSASVLRKNAHSLSLPKNMKKAWLETRQAIRPERSKEREMKLAVFFR